MWHTTDKYIWNTLQWKPTSLCVLKFLLGAGLHSFWSVCLAFYWHWHQRQTFLTWPQTPEGAGLLAGSRSLAESFLVSFLCWRYWEAFPPLWGRSVHRLKIWVSFRSHCPGVAGWAPFHLPQIPVTMPTYYQLFVFQKETWYMYNVTLEILNKIIVTCIYQIFDKKFWNEYNVLNEI